MGIKHWFIILSLLKCFISSAQYKVGVSYILSDITSKNISAFVQYPLSERHHLGMGIKYHFNDDSTKPIFRYYYRNLYSKNILNRLGITLDYKYYFLKKQFIIQPYFSYNFQYIRSGVKAHSNILDLVTLVYDDKPVTFDPINFFENHIGLGLDIQITDKLRSFIGMNGGGTFMTGIKTLEDLNAGRATNGFASGPTLNEFSWVFNTGFTYSVGQTKVKSKKSRK
jgi:hypothetical protein